MKCALICLEGSAGCYLSIGPSCGATLRQMMNWVSMAPPLVLVLESGFYQEMPFLHDPPLPRTRFHPYHVAFSLRTQPRWTPGRIFLAPRGNSQGHLMFKMTVTIQPILGHSPRNFSHQPPSKAISPAVDFAMPLILQQFCGCS